MALVECLAQKRPDRFWPARDRRGLGIAPCIEGGKQLGMQAHHDCLRIRPRPATFTFFNIDYCRCHELPILENSSRSKVAAFAPALTTTVRRRNDNG